MDLAIDMAHPRGGNHGLPRCWVVGSKRPSLMPDNVSRVITKIIMENIHEDGVNWKKVPDTHKEIYFRAFKNHFRWNPTDDSAVRNAFMKQSALRYADLLCRFKRDSANGRPKCVSQAAWVKWLAFWSRPEVMEKSEKARRNRYTEKAGPGTGCSRHCGGSRSAHGHAAVLEKEIGRPPNAYECSLRFHKKKNGTFVDERARIVAADVEERARAAREAGGVDNVNMTQLYVDVVGVQKQRVYGVGKRVETYVDLGPGALPPPVDERTVRQQVRQELQQQFEQQMAESDARLQQQLDAHRREMEQRMEAMRAQIMEEMRRQGPLPPPGLDA
ncbi:hypothetical protein CASFOL_002386 [Castilleja foliolosa]|uniref:Transposase n=1 Tax=Castilleja foliolosa TaxID=1961234 RepID=A0ABD3EHV3_9LAMI